MRITAITQLIFTEKINSSKGVWSVVLGHNAVRVRAGLKMKGEKKQNVNQVHTTADLYNSFGPLLFIKDQMKWVLTY